MNDAAVSGVSIVAYLDQTRELEFWLLDEHANVESPIGRLGSLTVAEGTAVLSVVVDTSPVTGGGVPPGSELVRLDE